MSRVIVPVNLGCCPEPPRCGLCAPGPARPTLETILALVDNYRREKLEPGDVLEVGFYGGPLPDPAWLDAVARLPTRVRVRPDLLTRAGAQLLADRGVASVELDALTLHDPSLKEVGRRYRAALVREILAGLADLRIEAGIVLAPGLPASSYATCLADARAVIGLVRTARLHPVLVLDRSNLREQHMDGLYRPLDLGEAITVCRAMLEILEDGGVKVVRIGQQPGPDHLGRAVAGPRHPSLRELVESRRALDALRRLMDGTLAGAHIVIRCAPSDETRTRGAFNQHLRTLRAQFQLADLRIQPDPSLARGSWEIQELSPNP